MLEGESKRQFEELTAKLVGQYTIPSDKAAEAVERLKVKAAKAWPLISHYVAVCMSRQPNKAGKQPPEWEDMAAVACAVQVRSSVCAAATKQRDSLAARAADVPPLLRFLLCGLSSTSQNMHLLATSLGVAAYWSSWQAVARDAPEMSEFLGLDVARGDKCLGVITLGLTERADSYRGSRTPAMDKVTWRS